MTEQTNAELIEEAQSLQDEFRSAQLPGSEYDADARLAYLDAVGYRAVYAAHRLAERLEAADQLAEIRGETIRTYERENAEWERRVHIAERKAAEYAAVVEKVQGLEPMWPRGMYGCPQDMFGRRQLQEALATAPADALRERDAALIEGLAEAFGENQLIREGDVKEWLHLKARQRREERA